MISGLYFYTITQSPIPWRRLEMRTWYIDNSPSHLGLECIPLLDSVLLYSHSSGLKAPSSSINMNESLVYFHHKHTWYTTNVQQQRVRVRSRWKIKWLLLHGSEHIEQSFKCDCLTSWWRMTKTNGCWLLFSQKYCSEEFYKMKEFLKFNNWFSW